MAAENLHNKIDDLYVEYKDDEAATPDGTEKMTREEDVEDPSIRVEKGSFSRKI